MVWPSRARHRERKHAFEEALDGASLDEDGNPFSADEGGERMLGPAVGGIGGLSVASGYVAQASLARAYAPDQADLLPVPRPLEAARAVAALLKSRAHGAGELRKLRRKFAVANHPDRVPPDLRDEAVVAMAEVNAAIDAALRLARGGVEPR